MASWLRWAAMAAMVSSRSMSAEGEKGRSGGTANVLPNTGQQPRPPGTSTHEAACGPARVLERPVKLRLHPTQPAALRTKHLALGKERMGEVPAFPGTRRARWQQGPQLGIPFGRV